MLRPTTVLFALVLSLCLAGALRADDTMTDNPAYQSWAKFKPGTFVKYSSDTTTMGNTTSMEMTETLKSISPDAAAVEMKMTMVMGGMKTDLPATTQNIPAKTKKVDIAATQTADAPKVDTRTEDVQAAGKTYSCKKTITSTDANGMTTKATVWTCDDIPGTMVKTESQTSGSGMNSTMKMLLTDFQPQ